MEYRLATSDPFKNSRDRIVPALVPALFEEEAKVLFDILGRALPGCEACGESMDSPGRLDRCRDKHLVCACGERFDRKKAKTCRRRVHPKENPPPPSSSTCDMCQTRMVVIEEGQTRHPSCEPGVITLPRPSAVKVKPARPANRWDVTQRGGRSKWSQG